MSKIWVKWASEQEEIIGELCVGNVKKTSIYQLLKKPNNQDFICVNNFNYLQLKIWLEMKREKYTDWSTERSILAVFDFSKRMKWTIFYVLSDWSFKFSAKCKC